MAAYPGGDHLYGQLPVNGLPVDWQRHGQSQGQHQAQSSSAQPLADFQTDLELFTNAQLFDLDMGEMPETQSPSSHDDGGDVWSVSNQYMHDGGVQNFNDYHPGQFHASYQSSSTPQGESMRDTPSEGRRDASGELRSAAPGSLEEASRMAAEEDKRRRNTAASARFRVKKKQREQALEKAAKDMTDRVSFLEQRVQTLEMENKLLKDLITDKQGGASGVDMEALKKKVAHAAQRAARGETVSSSSSSPREDAVPAAGRDSRREVKIESAETRQR